MHPYETAMSIMHDQDFENLGGGLKWLVCFAENPACCYFKFCFNAKNGSDIFLWQRIQISSLVVAFKNITILRFTIPSLNNEKFISGHMRNTSKEEWLQIDDYLRATRGKASFKRTCKRQNRQPVTLRALWFFLRMKYRITRRLLNQIT